MAIVLQIGHYPHYLVMWKLDWAVSSPTFTKTLSVPQQLYSFIPIICKLQRYISLVKPPLQAGPIIMSVVPSKGRFMAD